MKYLVSNASLLSKSNDGMLRSTIDCLLQPVYELIEKPVAKNTTAAGTESQNLVPNGCAIGRDISLGTVSASKACDKSSKCSVGGKRKSCPDDSVRVPRLSESRLSGDIVRGYCGENNKKTTPINATGMYICLNISCLIINNYLNTNTCTLHLRIEEVHI